MSNELGAGNPAGARASVFVAILVAATEGAAVNLALFSMRRTWGYAYSNVEEVVRYAMKMAPLVCASIITDALQGVLSGLRRHRRSSDLVLEESQRVPPPPPPGLPVKLTPLCLAALQEWPGGVGGSTSAPA